MSYVGRNKLINENLSDLRFNWILKSFDLVYIIFVYVLDQIYEFVRF